MKSGLAADLIDLVSWWWRKDRIRTSPREGKLLRLPAGTVLVIRGSRVEIRERHVVETHHGPILRYVCDGMESRCELWISTHPVPTVVCVANGEECELDAGEIEVWEPSRGFLDRSTARRIRQDNVIGTNHGYNQR